MYLSIHSIYLILVLIFSYTCLLLENTKIASFKMFLKIHLMQNSGEKVG